MSTEPHAAPDERRLLLLLDGLGESVVGLSADGRIVAFNRPAVLHLGIAHDAVIGRALVDVFPRAADLLPRIEQVRATGQPARFEAPCFARPETVIEIHLAASGDLTVLSFHDLAGAGQTRAALRESRVRLEIATAAAELGVWEFNLDTGRMMYSKRARTILGLPADGPVTLRRLRRLTHPDDRRRTALAARRAVDPKLRERAGSEFRIFRPSDGEMRWVSVHGQVVFARRPEGIRATRYIGTLQDITERHRAEAAIRASETRLRLALDAGRMAVWAYDLATQAIESSPELNRILGFPADAQPTLAEIDACYLPGEQERIRTIAREALARGERHFQAEYGWLRPDRAQSWLQLRAEIQLDAAGRPATVLGVLLDVTERKQAEARQQTLIHELNHRVKNILAAVQSLARQSFRGTGSSAEMREAFEARIQAFSRAHDVLTRQNWTGASLQGVVAEVTAPYREGGTRFSIEGPPLWLPPPLALTLSMALHELTTNALKYGALSVAGGTVSIGWRDVDRETGRGFVLVWQERGGPAVTAPTRRGFGTRLLGQGLSTDMGGGIDLAFLLDGVVCTITAPLPSSSAELAFSAGGGGDAQAEHRPPGTPAP